MAADSTSSSPKEKYREILPEETLKDAIKRYNFVVLDGMMEIKGRYRISEIGDIEIKRWIAGKEGNLRALLSTLQDALSPGLGWKPFTLDNLITPASVKRNYRKAALCTHPDKMELHRAKNTVTAVETYVAEKVFDLLRQARNQSET